MPSLQEARRLAPGGSSCPELRGTGFFDGSRGRAAAWTRVPRPFHCGVLPRCVADARERSPGAAGDETSPRPGVVVRPFCGPSDTTALQQLASARWPLGPHPGGLGWSAAIGGLGDEVLLAEDSGLCGWAILGGPELLLAVESSRGDVVDVLVECAVSLSGTRQLTVPVAHGDDVLRERLQRLGFRADPNGPPFHGMFRQAQPDPPVLPPGYHVRATRPTERAARVEVHRDAWHPASLPWTPGMAPPLSAGVASSFTASSYDSVRATWLYDDAFDLVVEAPDGSLAASCIAWFDPASKCAEIEPLGVVPEHRRRGLAVALCHEVSARCASRGGEVVFIHQGPRADYPAPAAAYAKAGFDVVSRGAYLTRLPPGPLAT